MQVDFSDGKPSTLYRLVRNVASAETGMSDLVSHGSGRCARVKLRCSYFPECLRLPAAIAQSIHGPGEE